MKVRAYPYVFTHSSPNRSLPPRIRRLTDSSCSPATRQKHTLHHYLRSLHHLDSTCCTSGQPRRSPRPPFLARFLWKSVFSERRSKYARSICSATVTIWPCFLDGSRIRWTSTWTSSVRVFCVCRELALVCLFPSTIRDVHCVLSHADHISIGHSGNSYGWPPQYSSYSSSSCRKHNLLPSCCIALLAFVH